MEFCSLPHCKHLRQMMWLGRPVCERCFDRFNKDQLTVRLAKKGGRK